MNTETFYKITYSLLTLITIIEIIRLSMAINSRTREKKRKRDK